MDEFHWLLDILQTIDVGLVVIDRHYRVQLWNGFMENHSGITASQLRDANLFAHFPELPEAWLKRMLETVFTLRSPVFSSWEQRARLFEFVSSRPFTGSSELMYQNLTLMPLASRSGECNHACLIIYDVTDAAMGKQGLQAANQQLRQLSCTDRLTGLYNRGHWEECLRQEYDTAGKAALPSSLLLLDIDFFKSINDNYGHQAGDEVLRQVASVLKQQLRTGDMAGRYGGEEFGVLLPQTGSTAALALAEKIRQAMAALRIPYEGQSLTFTISLGVAQRHGAHATPAGWLRDADSALYQAKHSGRNCTCLAPVPTPATALQDEPTATLL